jgi:hypothetical protein
MSNQNLRVMPRVFPPAFKAFPLISARDENSRYDDGFDRITEHLMRASRQASYLRRGFITCP